MILGAQVDFEYHSDYMISNTIIKIHWVFEISFSWLDSTYILQVSNYPSYYSPDDVLSK